jgi:hypothetical protein
MGLTSSQCLPEREDHLTVVVEAANRVRYRAGAGIVRNGHSFYSTIRVFP